ncbi:MAG: esterase/lipase family protein [Candidatus Thorarchaeota archaeon]
MGFKVRVVDLDQLDSLLQQPDILIIIGHGQRDGLRLHDDVISWSNLYDSIAEHNPKRAVVLACNSPTDKARSIFGFSGQIDAEAGALLALWHISEVLDSQIEISIPLDRIVDAQMNMVYPLGSYVYFVHGYLGDNDEFSDMITTLTEDWNLNTNYDGYEYFDYLADYADSDEAHEASIEEFAENFKDFLISNHPAGTQIDIVAHSMGGLITRQMLMEEGNTLESNGIEVKRVVTLATPHQGTLLAQPGLASIYVFFVDAIFGSSWASDVFAQMAPSTDFMTTLNDDPESYSDGIDWLTVSAIDYIGGLIVYPVHLDISDGIVGNTSAHLSFAQQEMVFSCDHKTLVEDTDQGRSYAWVGNWLDGGIDSDGDGLLDVEEVYVYGTDPNDSDSDNDALNDGDEVLEYGTDPNDSDTDDDSLSDGYEINHGVYELDPTYWSTDGDILSDGQEIAWGYHPCDADDPIPAANLIYLSKNINGITGYVRANHYAAIDYVKVYVMYKTSSGYWTSYAYVGQDSTPYYSGDYYVSWSIPQGYVQMKVKVNSYDSSNHYLGSDIAYVTLPVSGGGGDPPPF